MELPIQRVYKPKWIAQTHDASRSYPLNKTNPKPRGNILTKIKDSFFNHSGFELFDVKPQMPKQQISHFVKQAIKTRSLVALQINQEEDIVTEIIGYPSISQNSHHLIIESYNHKLVHLVTGSDIRHISRI